MAQFSALVLKNFTLYRRSWGCSVLELFLVFGVAIVVYVLRKLMDVDPQAQRSFIDDKNYTAPLPPDSPISQGFKEVLKNCKRELVDGKMNEGGKVAFSPPGDFILRNLQVRFLDIGYEIKYFNNSDEIVRHVRDPEYGKSLDFLCFGVVIQSSVSPNYTYSLWFNITTSNATTDGPRTDKEATSLYPFYRANFQPLIRSGMLETQNLIHNYIFQHETLNVSNILGGKVSPMRQESYDYDDFGSLMYDAFDFLLTLPFGIIYLRMTGIMMLEKQRKIKEVMKVMGMTNTSYYGSWILHEFLVFLVCSIFTAGMVKATLPRIDYFVPLILYVLYGLVLISQSLFIQVFFTRAKMVILFATFLFGFQYILTFLFKNSQEQSLSLSTGVSVSPVSGVSLALLAMVQYHSTGRTVNFGNITQEMSHIKISTVFLLQAANIVFWFTLFLYLEQVFPNEWGNKKHPLFVFHWLRSLCSRQRQKDKQPEAIETGNVSENAAQDSKYVVISQLTKRYEGSDRIALNNLSLRMIKGQIFCLLGHNGAGKTTTVGVLTGMFEPTNGRVSVFGLDLRTQLHDIRRIMGFCPQHNTLYDDLSVEQHLRLFARFKGFKGPEADRQIEELLRDMKLVEKRHALASTLSGGQKRRLSVGMAFAGGSQLVFLDEPTSGVDTSARRDIWQLLKQYRENRVIILTTHFMDEADHLADEIAILNCGRLVRSGTPFELKQREGMGYTLTVAKHSPQTNTADIMTVVQSRLPTAVLESGVGMQMVIRLPRQEAQQPQNGREQSNPMIQLFTDLEKPELKVRLGIESYGVNVASLEEIFISATDEPDPSHNLTAQETARQIELDAALQNLARLSPLLTLQQRTSPVAKQFWCTFVKRGRLSLRDWKTLLFEFVFPIILCCVVIILIRVNSPVDMPVQVISDALFKDQYPIQFPLAVNPAVQNGTRDMIKMRDFINRNPNYNASSYNATTIQRFDEDIMFPRKSVSLKGGTYFENTTRNSSVYNLVNTRSGAGPFLLSTRLTEAVIFNHTNRAVSINMINNPLPLTAQQKANSRAISGYIGAVGFGFALSFKFASVICMIVKEREERCKHQQKISGLRLRAYWAANLLFDFLTYLVLGVLIGVLCHAFNLSDFVGDATAATWLALILYAPANLLFTYLLSFAYDSHELAMAMHYFTNFILTGLLPAIIMVLRTIGGNSSHGGRGIAWLLRLLPPFGFGEVLIDLARKQVIEVQENDRNSLLPLSWPVASPAILYMGLLAVGYGVALWLLEWMNNRTQPLFCGKRRENAQAVYLEDSGLGIEVHALEKTYKPWRRQEVRAIRGVNLRIPRGEVFGLLGANGAGKSTLYKILTGETDPSEGDVFLMGRPLAEARKQLWKTIGYCPQFDALFESLTVRQHLDHYYRLKHLPPEHHSMTVDAQMGLLGMRKYEHVAAEKLSGGNKRRLSLAIALIGEPPVLLLDEASTGMDPLSRRLLWNVIAKAPRPGYTPTVLLTTHSMQQAEVLSNRLSIMAGGLLQCVDTPQNIKEQFHAGYEVDVRFRMADTKVIRKCGKINLEPQYRITETEYDQLINSLIKREQQKTGLLYMNDGTRTTKIQEKIVKSSAGRQLKSRILKGQATAQELVKFILLSKFAIFVEHSLQSGNITCRIVQSFDTYYCFRLEGPVVLSRLFGHLEPAKKRGSIDEYSIRQGSIEHIFNRLVEEQQQRERAQTSRQTVTQLQERPSLDLTQQHIL